MVDAVHKGNLTFPKLGLLLVKINLLSEPLLRSGCRQVPVLYSSGLYNKMKRLVNMMKQVKRIKLVIMSLRSVSASLGN